MCVCYFRRSWKPVRVAYDRGKCTDRAPWHARVDPHILGKWWAHEGHQTLYRPLLLEESACSIDILNEHGCEKSSSENPAFDFVWHVVLFWCIASSGNVISFSTSRCAYHYFYYQNRDRIITYFDLLKKSLRSASRPVVLENLRSLFKTFVEAFGVPSKFAAVDAAQVRHSVIALMVWTDRPA